MVVVGDGGGGGGGKGGNRQHIKWLSDHRLILGGLAADHSRPRANPLTEASVESKV